MGEARFDFRDMMGGASATLGDREGHLRLEEQQAAIVVWGRLLDEGLRHGGLSRPTHILAGVIALAVEAFDRRPMQMADGRMFGGELTIQLFREALDQLEEFVAEKRT